MDMNRIVRQNEETLQEKFEGLPSLVNAMLLSPLFFDLRVILTWDTETDLEIHVSEVCGHSELLF